MSLNWSAAPLAAAVASPACAAHAVARSQAKTRVGYQRPAMFCFEVTLGACGEYGGSNGQGRVVRTTWDALRSTHATRLARRSIRVLDVGSRTIPAGGRLGVPVPLLVFVFDDLRVRGRAWLGGGRAGRRKRRLVGRKRFREHAIDHVGPALVVADDLICDVGHWCTSCWQRSIWGDVAQH